MSVIVFPKDGQGFCAELKVGNDYHILLMAIHTAMGPMAAIYDVRANKWWRERQWAEDIEALRKKLRTSFAFIIGPSILETGFLPWCGRKRLIL
jgi:hypothetical protein